MRGVRWSGGHSYPIILAIIKASERKVTCMIAQHKNWIVVRWFDTTLELLKAKEGQFFINPPVIGATIKSSNRKPLPFQSPEISLIWATLM
jgi:hypothetical protein